MLVWRENNTAEPRKNECKIRFFTIHSLNVDLSAAYQRTTPEKPPAKTVIVTELMRQTQYSSSFPRVEARQHEWKSPFLPVTSHRYVSNASGHVHIRPSKSRVCTHWDREPACGAGGCAQQSGHSLLTDFGLYGGWISLRSSFSQSMYLKNACSLMSRSPSGPQPRRLPGCLVISFERKRNVQFHELQKGTLERLKWFL